jgi:ABC-type glycerol-3-phosphate transport system substrate-binding protein
MKTIYLVIFFMLLCAACSGKGTGYGHTSYHGSYSTSHYAPMFREPRAKWTKYYGNNSNKIISTGKTSIKLKAVTSSGGRGNHFPIYIIN